MTFISWVDAQQCAAWAGMRLPTEAEWMLAVRASTRREFVFGATWPPSGTAVDAIADARLRQIQAAGSTGAAFRGPFGHRDLCGQIWEWTASRGKPQATPRRFEQAYRDLRADLNYGSVLPEQPRLRDEHRIAKGGSFLSFSPLALVQLRVGVRAPLTPNQTLETLGMRFARDPQPARTRTLSLLRAHEARDTVPMKLDPHRQIGIEHDTLDPAGRIIERYDAISFVPATAPGSAAASDGWSNLGLLITTVPLQQPDLPPGAYLVALGPNRRPRYRSLEKPHQQAWGAAVLLAASGQRRPPGASMAFADDARIRLAIRVPAHRRPEGRLQTGGEPTAHASRVRIEIELRRAWPE